MAKISERLTDRQREFIAAQPMFFIATAPPAGRINLSPKGMDTFRVLDEATVAYLDLTGSGNETAAHLLADGRCTVMFCSFDQTPMILRLYGRGQVLRPGTAEWRALRLHFPSVAGERQIVRIDVESVQSSCGYAVPVAEAMQPRDRLVQWCEEKGEEGLVRYRERNNRVSIDGLPTGLDDEPLGP